MFYFHLLSTVEKDDIDDLFSMKDSNWKNDSQGHAPLVVRWSVLCLSKIVYLQSI